MQPIIQVLSDGVTCNVWDSDQVITSVKADGTTVQGSRFLFKKTLSEMQSIVDLDTAKLNNDTAVLSAMQSALTPPPQ